MEGLFLIFLAILYYLYYKSPDAIYLLQNSFLEEDYVGPCKKTLAEKAKELQLAVAKGNTEAMLELAQYLERGYGVIKNRLKAFALYEKAAKLGNKEAKECVCYINKRQLLRRQMGVDKLLSNK